MFAWPEDYFDYIRNLNESQESRDFIVSLLHV